MLIHGASPFQYWNPPGGNKLQIWLRRSGQGRTNQLPVAADENLAVSIGRSRPVELSAAEGVSGIDEVGAGKFLVALAVQLGGDQISFVAVDEDNRTRRREIDFVTFL